MDLLKEALAGHDRGWQFIPLIGKIPDGDGWSRPDYTCTKEQIRDWVERGYNLGIVTGKPSGIVIVDLDGVDAPTDGTLPITQRVSTRPVGQKRYHLYYRYTKPIRNSQSQIARNIDVRGDGGYAVFPGSLNYEADGFVYQWASGKDIPIVDFPDELHEKLKPQSYPVPPPVDAEPVGLNEPWFDAALKDELAKLAGAPEGERNATLNKTTFKVAQRVRATARDQGEIRELLRETALSIGLGEKETSKTIASGWAAGVAKAVSSPEAVSDRTLQLKFTKPDGDYVLAPGAHEDDQGRIIKVSNADFCESVLRAMPEDLLYERERVPGIIEEGKFLPLLARRSMIRVIIDKHTEIQRWRTFGKGKSATQGLEYVNCNADHGLLLADHAVHHARSLRVITRHPIFYGKEWRLIDRPGYTDGVWLQPALGEVIEIERDPVRILDVLEELVTDFPFNSRASMANFFALMLTPLVRHTFVGNVPMFLACSPVERTGKTKLIEEVFGGVMLGEPVMAIQVPQREEERAKTFLSLAMNGTALVHLDNLPPSINSASLASLVTAKTFAGRMLGVSQIVEASNTLTICASGNNIDFSGELAKRTVPIELDTGDEVPELRTGFRYPDLWGHVMASRSRALGSLLGAVLNWREDGSPGSSRAFGGFEAWSRTVGGILEHMGYPDVLDNRTAWVEGKGSREVEDLEILFGLMPKERQFTAREMVREASDLFESVASAYEDGAKAIRLGKILGAVEGRVVGGWRLVRGRSRGGRWFRLDKVGPGNLVAHQVHL